MKLNAPAGVNQVFDDGSNLIAVVNGQVDVEPHVANILLAQGFTSAGSDGLTDSAPVMQDQTVSE